MGGKLFRQIMSLWKIGDVAASTELSSDIEPRHLMVQNHLLIWVDENSDEANENCQNMLAQLRSVVSNVSLCTDSAQCIDVLNDADSEKAFIITSGDLGQHLVPEIHKMTQVDSIYIFSNNQVLHETWTKDWSKIQGIFTSIQSICDLLKTTVCQCDHHAIPMSFVPKLMIETVVAPVVSDEQKLDQLEPSFMYSLLFKKILLEIDEDDAKPLQDLVVYCRSRGIPESQLELFQEKYYHKTPVWWYTYDTFLYSMLNRALWTLDMGTMIKMGFFIRNLHRQLQRLHREQSDAYKKQVIVYRGQGHTQQDFRHLLDTKGGLLSFNNFLSTSTEKHVAMEFIERALQKIDTVGVLFIITIDPSSVSISNAPFALIDAYSAITREKETLFSMHSIFRVEDIQQTINNNRLWEVQLTLTDHNDPQLAALTDRIEGELRGSTGWQRLGDLMIRAGHFNQAEDLYNELFKNSSSDSDRAEVYHQLGCVNNMAGKYKDAISFYEKSLEIKKNILPEEHLSLADTYDDIGEVYTKMGEYSKALEFLEKALRTRKRSLPSNHPDLAETYNNIGAVYHYMGNYAKALEFYEKDLEITESILPPNHPDLAVGYNNVAIAYNNMGNYSKALEFYEKAHTIHEKSLPSNHPDLAISYNNIGALYQDIGDYSKALEFYKKGLQIREESLHPNHPDFAFSYNSIGLAYKDMGGYSKAFEFFEKALKIREESLSPDHPHFAISYRNLAACYQRMGNFASALKTLQNSFEIQQKIFEEGNLEFTYTYIEFGRIYHSMREHSKALDYFEKCLTIFNHTLTEKNSKFCMTYSFMGDVHRLLGDYEMALSYHLKALNIQESVPCSPLECATIYANTGETYREMKDYATALAFFQKALEIHERNLLKDHPDLAVINHSLAKLYLATREHSVAMENVQKAIEIAQAKLPSDHPHLLDFKETFEKIRVTL